MYIVSACLLGCDCKYSGGNNRNEKVLEFTKEHKYIMICPETEGGLESPRPPAEQVPVVTSGEVDAQDVSDPSVNNTQDVSDLSDENARTTIRVIDREGNDVTREFVRGAEICLRRALDLAEKSGEEIEGAILKANSPSCGSGRIYDGTFTGTLKEGDGIFAAMLKERGIPVVTEMDFDD